MEGNEVFKKSPFNKGRCHPDEIGMTEGFLNLKILHTNAKV